MKSHDDVVGRALAGVEVDEYGWPIDDNNFDLYLQQFDEVKNTSEESREEVQGFLFDVPKAPDEEPAVAEIYKTLRAAFLDVNEHRSSDYVIADPKRNSLFVHACWKRGIEGTQVELNRLLLRARKSSKFGKIPNVEQYRVPREVIEKYEFASEVAARLLQDRVFHREGNWVSLDDILCEPKLGRQFLAIAESITPGFEERDYRWAALSIRKAMNRKVATSKDLERPAFRLLGSADSFSFETIPEQPGFFEIMRSGIVFYVGHASNLREKVGAMVTADIAAKIDEQCSQLLFPPEPLEYAIAPAPTMPISYRFDIKKLVVQESNPRLNITKDMDRKAA